LCILFCIQNVISFTILYHLSLFHYPGRQSQNDLFKTSPKNVNTNLRVVYLKCQVERKLEGLYMPAFERRKCISNNRSSVWSTKMQKQWIGLVLTKLAVCMCGENYWLTVLPFHQLATGLLLHLDGLTQIGHFLSGCLLHDCPNTVLKQRMELAWMMKQPC